MRHTAHTTRSSSMASAEGSSGAAAGDTSSQPGDEAIDVEATNKNIQQWYILFFHLELVLL